MLEGDLSDTCQGSCSRRCGFNWKKAVGSYRCFSQLSAKNVCVSAIAKCCGTRVRSFRLTVSFVYMWRRRDYCLRQHEENHWSYFHGCHQQRKGGRNFAVHLFLDAVAEFGSLFSGSRALQYAANYAPVCMRTPFLHKSISVITISALMLIRPSSLQVTAVPCWPNRQTTVT